MPKPSQLFPGVEHSFIVFFFFPSEADCRPYCVHITKGGGTKDQANQAMQGGIAEENIRWQDWATSTDHKWEYNPTRWIV